jgi:NAD(P)-dependent dehydrogenase (short-subunit alcohol dehydrogenase family)
MKRNDMEKRSVLITGASSGIGKECALLLASLGFQVFAGVRKLEDAAALTSAGHASLVPVMIDVTVPSSIQAAVQSVSAALPDDASFGLVNNAGIAVAAPLELLDLDALRKQFEVNVFGHVAVTQAFLPILRSHRGRIVFIGSLFGKIGVPLVSPYSAAKFAIEAIADAFAIELWPWGIRVSLLEPGNVVTPIWEKGKSHLIEAYGVSAPETRELYRDAHGSMVRLAEWFGKTGITPQRVAHVVEKALRARRPRSRYLVGWVAKILGRIVPLGPDRLRYWVIRRIIAPR